MSTSTKSILRLRKEWLIENYDRWKDFDLLKSERTSPKFDDARGIEQWVRRQILVQEMLDKGLYPSNDSLKLYPIMTMAKHEKKLEVFKRIGS